MAGVHQLWAWSPFGNSETGPADGGMVESIAGTTNEGIVDGPSLQAWFAQPSGLAASADGERVWIADS
jgi:hypothetical protein